MHPGPWRNPERDRDLHTALKLVNGLLALAHVVVIGWLIKIVCTVIAGLFT